jgi:hypothetical protein
MKPTHVQKLHILASDMDQSNSLSVTPFSGNQSVNDEYQTTFSNVKGEQNRNYPRQQKVHKSQDGTHLILNQDITPKVDAFNALNNHLQASH